MSENIIYNEVIDATIERVISRHPIIQGALDHIEATYAQKQYHNLKHTKDVMKTAVMLGLMEKLSEEEIDLECIIAAHHDYYQGDWHEEKSAQFVGEEMTKRGYQIGQISTVTAAIKVTRVDPNSGTRPQASSLVEKIIQDADVANFGRGDSIALLFAFYKELIGKEYGTDTNIRRKNFIKRTIQILKNLTWQTESARSLYQEGKSKTLAMLLTELDSLNAPGSTEQ